MENQALTSSLVRASPFPSLSSSCCFKAFPLHYRQKRVSLRYVKSKHTDLINTEHISTEPSCISKTFGRSSQKHDANNPIHGFVEIQCKMRWAVLLLYRALLVGGISFTMASPAIANTDSLSSPPSAYEVVIEKEEGKNNENAEKGEIKPQDLDKISQCETTTFTHAYILGDDFWKDVPLLKGSTEMMLKSILDKDPKNVSALECLAKRLVEIDDSSHALVVIEKLQFLQPNEIEWKYMKAEAYDSDGQFQLARQGFEDILKIEPLSCRALQGLIMTMDQLNESGLALKIAEESMAKAKQENNVKEARNIGILIGQVYTLKGHFEQALKHYKIMVEEDGNDFRPYLCQGIIYSVLGEKETAERHFKNYEELCPKELPGRSFLDRLMFRARKQGQKIYDHKSNSKSKMSE